jgi:hypothetical protein
MKASLGLAVLIAAMAFTAPAAMAATRTAPQAKAVATPDATDLGSRRVHRRYPA